jgi:hypothetical protein
MRSIKLLVATAVVAALVAGPVLAQDTMGGAAPSTPSASDSSKPAKSHGKHHAKKHSKKKSTTSTTPAQ